MRILAPGERSVECFMFFFTWRNIFNTYQFSFPAHSDLLTYVSISCQGQPSSSLNISLMHISSLADPYLRFCSKNIVELATMLLVSYLLKSLLPEAYIEVAMSTRNLKTRDGFYLVMGRYTKVSSPMHWYANGLPKGIQQNTLKAQPNYQIWHISNRCMTS